MISQSRESLGAVVEVVQIIEVDEVAEISRAIIPVLLAISLNATTWRSAQMIDQGDFAPTSMTPHQQARSAANRLHGSVGGDEVGDVAVVVPHVLAFPHDLAWCFDCVVA